MAHLFGELAEECAGELNVRCKKKRNRTMDYKQGIVYILSNEAMPGLLKIGLTTRKDLSARLRELYTTGVPVPFRCEYAC